MRLFATHIRREKSYNAWCAGLVCCLLISGALALLLW
jgi:hypothetical protein